ncbi:tetratricopeptide repeat protein [Candidatus Latescibacterota bacterium]
MARLIIIIVICGVILGCSGGITTDTSYDYDSLIESGWERYNQSRYDEAYRLFLDAEKENNNRPEAYIGCGWTLLKKQHPDSAIVAFKSSFYYITTLEDSVDCITGLAGSYMADWKNTKVIDLFETYKVSSYKDAFPLKKHDFSLDETVLEIVQAMAYYRLGLFSFNEKPDPENATYHLNQVLFTPWDYTDQKELMSKITEFIEMSKGDYYK